MRFFLLIVIAFVTTCVPATYPSPQETASVTTSMANTPYATVTSVPLTPSGMTANQTTNYSEDRLSQLWSITVSLYLRDKLWKTRDIYDARHTLMLPLHIAFQDNRISWIDEFHDHFSRFAVSPEEEMDSGRLNRLHYFYVVSRYLCLSVDYGQRERIPPGLEARTREEIHALWNALPAWQWDRTPFEGGMQERISYKLKHKDVPKSYYRAIIDEELFTFAIAADLVHLDRSIDREKDPILVDILETAKVVFQNEIVHCEDGGWLLQPGVWTDHPGHAYAGHTELVPGLEPKPKPNAAWDSSHSHRRPLWLLSLMNAYPSSDENYTFYQSLLGGLKTQFFEHVLVLPSQKFPAPRLTNFMDGWNGIYRYNPEAVGNKLGYGPYQLSGILLIGWWIFLGTDDLRSLYADMSRQFPLRQDIVNLYTDSVSTRERHPLVTMPDYYNNGFAELYTLLAAQLRPSLIKGM